MIFVLAAVAALIQPPAPSDETCEVLTPIEGGYRPYPFPALKLLNQSGAAALPPLPVGGGVGIRCLRQGMAIGPQDYRIVTQYQMPLMITAGARVGLLETFEGRFRLRMIQGEFTPAETGPAQQALEVAQSALALAARTTAGSKTSPASRPAAQKPR